MKKSWTFKHLNYIFFSFFYHFKMQMLNCLSIRKEHIYFFLNRHRKDIIKPTKSIL